ncbi:MAG: DNA repair protein RadC [Verrucomicrobiota bacterium]
MPSGKIGSVRLHDLPESERPRERLAREGARSLSDAELIAIFLRTGVQGANAVDLAHSLLKEFGSIRKIASLPTRELEKTRGVGPAKAAHLAAAFEIGSRLAREQIQNRKIDSPETVYDMLGREMGVLTKESLRVVLLNTRYEWIRTEEISLGSLNESIAHPREVIQPAIIHSAYAFILVHNHPSGDPTPSKADRELTRRLSSIGNELGLKLADHVIIGQPCAGSAPYFSFKEMGLL